MDKKCGMIIHPEDFDDILGMSPDEAGNVTQNAIKTFLGRDDLVSFEGCKDERFLSRVSRDMCSRVERDKKTYVNKAAAGSKGGKASAERRQQSSKSEAKSKQTSSKSEANAKQTSSPIPIPKPIPKPNISSYVEEIVRYLNEKTGKHFQAKGETVKYINGRLNDGYTVNDFKRVIDKKTRKWKDDPKMVEFLRPSTLFAPSHFDEYLNEPDIDPHVFKPNQFNTGLQRSDYDMDELERRLVRN